MTRGLALAGMLAAAACGDDSPSTPAGPSPTPEAPPVQFNTTITLSVGQSVTLPNTSGNSTLPGTPDPGSVLTFQRVAEDSRCPATANCIQAGQAVTAMTLLVGGDAHQPFELKTSKRELDLSSYQFKLESLTPYPQGSEPIPESAYRLTFQVSRR